MGTTTTLVSFKQRLVTVLDAALTEQVSYGWLGPASESSAVFLGRAAFRDGGRIAGEQRTLAASDLAAIKTGRQQRDETYTVEVTVRVFRSDLSSDGAATAEAAADAIAQTIDSVLADDPKIGLTSIQWARLGDKEYELIPYENGWASSIVLSINVQARLT